MDELKAMDKSTITVINTIQSVIINEIGGLIYPKGKKTNDCFKQSSPYIKFLPIISTIEFLGACYDELPFDTTRINKREIVEIRFNKALKNLFNKRYLPYTKANNEFYFYHKLRCNMIHQLRPGKGLFFTTRFESKDDGTKHLGKIDGGIILVLEDFYDDLRTASENLISKFKKKIITNKKGESEFLNIITLKKV